MRPIKHLKKALTTKIVSAHYKRMNVVYHIRISNHASARFRERLEYVAKYIRANSTRTTVEEFEPVYQEFIGYFYEYNLASLFNMSSEIMPDEIMAERNKKYVSTRLFRVSNFDFIVEDDTVKTVELNGYFRKLNVVK